jgi:beta-lactam-binding protein with PASTA domain
MYPKNDPKVIVYVAMQRSHNSNVLPQTVKTIVKDTAKYLKIFDEAPELIKEVESYKLDNYINKNIIDVKKSLEDKKAKYIVFGNGDIVINQYPFKNSLINTKDKVFIFTNDDVIIMPDLTSYSIKEAIVVLEKLGINYEMNATGYIGGQSISPGTKIEKDMIVVLN